MTDLMVFSNESFGKVRSISINGAPWFVGKDVANILGYNNTPRAVRVHVKEKHKRVTKMVTPVGSGQSAVVIDEAGLYSLILRSKLPMAEAFQEWIVGDVIPQIRKTGGYGTSQVDVKALARELRTELAPKPIELDSAAWEERKRIIKNIEWYLERVDARGLVLAETFLRSWYSR